jgi:hypothetical protein
MACTTCRFAGIEPAGRGECLAFEREHHFVQTGMCFAERFIAVEPTPVAKTRDHSLRSFWALTLSIINHPRSITAAMDTGGNPTRCGTREFCCFCEKVNERLLPALRNDKDIDLSDGP